MAVLKNGCSKGGQVGQLAQAPHCLKGLHKNFNENSSKYNTVKGGPPWGSIVTHLILWYSYH